MGKPVLVVVLLLANYLVSSVAQSSTTSSWNSVSSSSSSSSSLSSSSSSSSSITDSSSSSSSVSVTSSSSSFAPIPIPVSSSSSRSVSVSASLSSSAAASPSTTRPVSSSPVPSSSPAVNLTRVYKVRVVCSAQWGAYEKVQKCEDACADVGGQIRVARKMTEECVFHKENGVIIKNKKCDFSGEFGPSINNTETEKGKCEEYCPIPGSADSSHKMGICLLLSFLASLVVTLK